MTMDGIEIDRFSDRESSHVLQCVAVCCSVLQCAAVCCSLVEIDCLSDREP